MAMLRRIWSFAASLLLAFSGLTLFAQNATVTGTVTYLQRIALPPTAVVRVMLEDVSLADAPAKILAEREIPTAGKQVPIPFDLTYSPSDVQPSHRYSVRATIKADDKLLFTSTTSYPVLTNGAPLEVKIMLQQAAQQSAATGTPFEGTHWALTYLNGRRIAQAEGRQQAYLLFAADGDRVTGSTGCNRLTGTYKKTGSDLKFLPIVTTMMACMGPVGDQEHKFNSALDETTHYRIKGTTLLLLNENDVVAKFKAQPEDQQNPNP
jgi:putative lipoprotein